ncbi:MAG: IS5 family transposase [Phycisphaerales bacterium]|nr:IS5 family transposase [Phycisphaerales bacterium]
MGKNDQVMYSTDLTDSQWEVMEDILNDKRKRKYSLRDIINGIFYLKRTGCQWRLAPKEYPPYLSCFYYFRKWTKDGTWARINKALVELFRLKKGRKPSPSVGIIDSQTVESSEWGVPEKGFDGGKWIKGRKRHIIVDTLGCILAVIVHNARTHDSKGAVNLLKELFEQKYCRIFKIIAGSAYRGILITIAAVCHGWMIEIFSISNVSKFRVIPQRWKVERTFGWCNWDRRLSKDYECETDSAAAFVYISNIHRLIKNF